MPALSTSICPQVDMSIVDPATQALHQAFLECPLSDKQREVVREFIQLEGLAQRLFSITPCAGQSFAVRTTAQYEQLLSALRAGAHETMSLVVSVLALFSGEAHVLN